MRKYCIVLLSLLLVVGLYSLSYAAVGIQKDGVGEGTATDLNFPQGAASNDGSAWSIGSSVSTEIATTVTVIPLTYTTVPVTISTRTVTVAAGKQGQVLRIVGVHRPGSGTLTITAAANTGITSITMDADGEEVTLQYVDDTFGWIVIGYKGATIT